MLYVSNIRCGCGEFLLATKSGFMCPHCANQYEPDELMVAGDLVEVSISADVSWYEKHKEFLKTIDFLDFLGFDDASCTEDNTFGFVDFGMENPTHKHVTRLVSMLDPIIDKKYCTHLDPFEEYDFTSKTK